MPTFENLTLRQAVQADLDGIVALLADDPLGRARERPGDPAYAAAFQALEEDPNNELWVLDAGGGDIAGVVQLTFVPGLSRLGALRAMIESVRVGNAWQGKGVGRWLFERMIARARAREAVLVQLTSDKSRPDAIRFY